MTRYVLSPRAQADLSEIWDYTVKRWGVSQADTYLRQLEASIKTVAASPALGMACDHIRPGYRKYPSGSHLLFYRTREDVIDIVRILHARMDIARNL